MYPTPLFPELTFFRLRLIANVITVAILVFSRFSFVPEERKRLFYNVFVRPTLRSRAKLETKISHIDTRLTRGNMELAIKRSGNMALVLPDKPGKALGTGKGGKEEEETEQATFAETLGSAMTKEHDVTQVLAVQPDDPFTRPQRLMVMLCLILGQTAVAAVFFGIDPSNIGAKILIGIFTAVLLLPSNFLFKILFKKSIFRAPPDRKRRGRRERPPR
jgi:hypothetical protein